MSPNSSGEGQDLSGRFRLEWKFFFYVRTLVCQIDAGVYNIMRKTNSVCGEITK